MTVHHLPEVGRIPIKEPSVSLLPYWILTFGHMNGLSIWTDDPQRIEVIAPGSMKFSEAVCWARNRVPNSWMLIEGYRVPA